MVSFSIYSTNLKPYRGSSAHEWLIFLRALTLCLNNAGIASIMIEEGMEIAGRVYLLLEDMYSIATTFLHRLLLLHTVQRRSKQTRD